MMDVLECETANFIVVVDLRLCPWSFITKSLRYSGLTQLTPVHEDSHFINDTVMNFQPVKLHEKGHNMVKF